MMCIVLFVWCWLDCRKRDVRRMLCNLSENWIRCWLGMCISKFVFMVMLMLICLLRNWWVWFVCCGIYVLCWGGFCWWICFFNCWMILLVSQMQWKFMFVYLGLKEFIGCCYVVFGVMLWLIRLLLIFILIIVWKMKNIFSNMCYLMIRMLCWYLRFFRVDGLSCSMSMQWLIWFVFKLLLVELFLFNS